MVVPVEAWDPYVVGVSRWLAWHAVALRTVHVRFEVRRRMLLSRCAHHTIAAIAACICGGSCGDQLLHFRTRLRVRIMTSAVPFTIHDCMIRRFCLLSADGTATLDSCDLSMSQLWSGARTGGRSGRATVPCLLRAGAQGVPDGSGGVDRGQAAARRNVHHGGEHLLCAIKHHVQLDYIDAST